MATGTPSVPNSLRREVEGIPQIMPSAGISSFTRGVNVTPPQYVQNIANAQQTSNFLTALGQFNDGLTRFGQAYNKYDTERQTLQGQADAMANPEFASQVLGWREELDKAAKDGRFPQSAHPKYRAAFLETAASLKTMQDLPQFLEESARQSNITSPDSTESIGGHNYQKSLEWMGQNIPNPLGQVAALKTLGPIVNQITSQQMAQRESRYKQQQYDDLGQAGSLALSGLASDIVGVASNKPGSSEDTYGPKLAQFQNEVEKVNNLLGPDKANEFYLTTVSANYTQIAKTQGQAVADKWLELVSDNVTSGKGTYAGKPEIKEKLDKLVISTASQQITQQNALIENFEKVQKSLTSQVKSTVFNEVSQTGGVSDATAASLKQSIKQAYGKKFTDAEVDTIIFQAADDAKSMLKNRPITDKTKNQLMDEARYSPTSALQKIRDFRDILPPNDYEELNKTAQASLLNEKAFKDAGYDDILKNDVLDPIKQTQEKASTLNISVNGTASSAPTLTPEQAENNVIKLSRAEQMFERNVRRKVDDLNSTDPDGRKRLADPTGWNQKIKDIMREEAMSTRRTIQEGEVETTQKDDPNVGRYAPTLNAIKNNYDAVEKTPNDSFQSKVYLAQAVPVELENMANDIFMGDEKTQAKSSLAYFSAMKRYGFNPDGLLEGHTEHGVQIPEKLNGQPFRIDPLKDRVFQNLEQLNAYKKEAREFLASGRKDYRLNQLFAKLGLKNNEQQQAFLKYQEKQLVTYNPNAIDIQGYPQ